MIVSTRAVCKSCFDRSDMRNIAVPNCGVLPLRCAVDLLPNQCTRATGVENKERTIADTCAIFRLLIQRGASVNTPSVGIYDKNETKTPLLALCELTSTVALIQCLIEEGADVKVADKRGFTPLHWCMQKRACEGKRNRLVHLLLDRGADVNTVTDEGDTLLHFSATRCAAKMLRVLLEKGADVKAVNSRRQSALHAMFAANAFRSAWNSNIVACLDALLTAGADVCAKDASGQTPFMILLGNMRDIFLLSYAMLERDRTTLLDICSLLAAYGTRLNQAFVTGNTLAHVAAQLDNVALLQMYMEHGGEVDALYPCRGTPLNVALRHNSDNVVLALLRLGAHVDAGHDGEDFFRQFAYHGDAGTVKEQARKPATHCKTLRRRCSAAFALPVRTATGRSAHCDDSPKPCREEISALT